MNESFVKARTIFDRMMEESLARHSECMCFTFLSLSLHPLTATTPKTMNSNAQPTHNRNPPSHGPNRVHRDSNRSASVVRLTNHRRMDGTKAYTTNLAITLSQRPPPGMHSLSRVAPSQTRMSAWGAVPHMLLHSRSCSPNRSPNLMYILHRNRCSRHHNPSPRRHTCNHIQHRTTNGIRTINNSRQQNPTLGRRLLRFNQRDNLRASNNPKSKCSRSLTVNLSHNCTMLSRGYPSKHNLRRRARYHCSNSNSSLNLNPKRKLNHRHSPQRPMYRRKRSNRP